MFFYSVPQLVINVLSMVISTTTWLNEPLAARLQAQQIGEGEIIFFARSVITLVKRGRTFGQVVNFVILDILFAILWLYCFHESAHSFGGFVAHLRFLTQLWAL